MVILGTRRHARVPPQPLCPLLAQATSLVISLAAVVCSLPMRLSHGFLSLNGLRGFTDMPGSVQTMMFLLMLGTVAYLTYRCLIWVVFGDLRATERMRCFDRILTFLLVKIFIMTGMLDSDHFYRWREKQGLVLYTASLAGTGLIKHLIYISQERLEHLMSDPATGMTQVLIAKRTVVLLVGCTAMEVGLLLLVVYTLQSRCPVMVPLLLYDGIIACIEAANTTCKYVAFLKEETSETEEDPDESAQPSVLDMAVRLAIQGLSLVYYLHVWLLKGPAFKLVDGVLLLVVRKTLVKGTKVLSEYHAAKEIANNIDSQYPDAAPQDLAALSDDDICAICLKSLKTRAKKLSCDHLFHGACIRQCMEKSTEPEPRCPLCRKPFAVLSRAPPAASDFPTIPPDTLVNTFHPHDHRIGTTGGANRRRAPLVVTEVNAMMGGEHGVARGGGGLEERSIFRLTSDQLPPWVPIPSFALEVVRRSHTSSPPRPAPRAGPPPTPPGVASMIRQVQEVLPQVPREAIRAEVMRTSRVEVAIEALLATPPHLWDRYRPAALAGGDGRAASHATPGPVALAGEPSRVGTGLWSITTNRLLSAFSQSARRVTGGMNTNASSDNLNHPEIQGTRDGRFGPRPAVPQQVMNTRLAADPATPPRQRQSPMLAEPFTPVPVRAPLPARHPFLSTLFSGAASAQPSTATTPAASPSPPPTSASSAHNTTSPPPTQPPPSSLAEHWWRAHLHWPPFPRHPDTQATSTTTTRDD